MKFLIRHLTMTLEREIVVVEDELKRIIQEEKSLSAEEKLNKALERLLAGKPLRTKAKGKLTLNKINVEAGLGRSYIHKFKKFIDDVAEDAIENYNNPEKPELGTQDLSEHIIDAEDISEIEKLREELKHQINLKEDYRKERNELLAINDELEVLNKSLMFRVYELQQEIEGELIEYEHHKK